MRGTFEIKPGAVVGVKHHEQALLVKAWLDHQTVVVENLVSGFTSNIPVRELQPFERKKSSVGDLADLSDKQWKQAKQRFKAIEPLLTTDSRRLVVERAKELDVSPATIYRWIKSFKESGVISSLIRTTRNDKGVKKLTEKQEQLIESAISEEYLIKERPTATTVYELLVLACKKHQVPPPALSTFRARIHNVSDELKINKRYGKHTAFTDFAPKTTNFPGGHYPYAVLQIDHKLLDVFVVDDDHRLAVGRAWITVAIDVYSRIIAGYYLSLESPSAISVGMCLAMAMLPKENLFALHSIEGTWPSYGIPTKVHVDNAKEFRGRALAYAADEYNFEIAFRKVKRPHYGGHIESLLGTTFTTGMDSIPGRTFSNPVERGDYPSEKMAVLTMKELDVWMLDFIANTYNQKRHTETLTPPIHRYIQGLLGSNDNPGPGRICIPVSGNRLLIDFLPILTRPVHRPGIIIDYIWYYDEVLNRWINAPDPLSRKKKRQFIIRRDPRDISYIWFYDPEIKEYHRIAYQNLGRPPMSIWEYKAVRKWMKEQGIKATDEDTIFKSLEHRREIVDQAKLKTKKARKELQRAKLNQEPLPSHQAVAPKPTYLPDAQKQSEGIDELFEDIEPYDDIDFY